MAAAQTPSRSAPVGARAPVGRRVRRWLSSRGPGFALIVVVAAVYLFLYLPAIVIAMYSFNDSSIMSWPLSGFTTRWYAQAFHDHDLVTGLKNSVIVALSSTAIALVLGVPAGFGFDRFSFPGKSLFQRILILPFLMPGVIGGIALLTFFIDLKVTLSLQTVIIAHATMLLSAFVIQMAVGLSRWDRSLESAAMDLGANEIRTFVHVILPNFWTTIAGACLLSITISLDEIARTFFVTGTQNTLPMVIWSDLHHQLTPEINAMGSVILGFSLAALVIWSRLVARRGQLVGR
jgi:spermidine/putrescine transport system permease protein